MSRITFLLSAGRRTIHQSACLAYASILSPAPNRIKEADVLDRLG